MKGKLTGERRAFTRFQSGTTVVQLVFSGNQGRRYGFLDDISEGGIAVVVLFPIIPEEQFTVRMNLPNNKQKLNLFCRAIYCHQRPHDLFGQTSYRAGLQIMDPDAETRILIKNYISYLQSQDSSYASKSILLLSESRSALYLLSQILTAAGFKVDSTAKASEAIEAYNFSPYDVAIIDLSMSGDSSIETAAKIKEIDKNARIIFFSNLECQKNIDIAHDFGADLYVIKPTNADQLLGIVTGKLKL